jgi:CBS domain-containing protein
MTRDPITVPAGARMSEALEILQRHKISELPVVDEAGRPVGLLDITDLIGIQSAEFRVLSAEWEEEDRAEQPKQSA